MESENDKLKRMHYLTIKHINAQSLQGHFDEIALLIRERKIDILCVSETWLTPLVANKYVDIPDFNIFRHDLKPGGGVCIYVRSDLKVTRIEPKVENGTLVEDIWLQIQFKKLPSIIIGTIYRHPKALSDSFDYILSLFKEICLRNKPVFILGDLNDDLLLQQAKLHKIIKIMKLSQVIEKPTRITETSKTLIDVLITNKNEMIVHTDVVPCPVADHELVCACINLSKPKRIPETKTYRCLKDYSPEILCNLILEHNAALNGMLNTDDIDIQVPILTRVMNDCIDNCAPTVTKLISRPPAPWIDQNIKTDMKVRDEINRCLKADRENLALQIEHKERKKAVKSSLHMAKTKYFQEEFEKCGRNTTKKWKVAKKLIPENRNKSNKQMFSNVQDKVEKFNQFFSQVGEETFRKTQDSFQNTNTNAGNPTNHRVRTRTEPNFERPLFRPTPVSVEVVILTFKRLKETHAIGSDNIAYCFIRDSLPVTSFYITVIVNTSIVTGLYATFWKHALVVPAFKSGDYEDPSNFRPISILPVISKILERIVADQLPEYLETNRLISNTQHGFRSKLSTETALLAITEEIYENIDSNKISLLSLLDLSKAFDSVNHEFLLKKMQVLYIDRFWFEDYLSNRTQSVKMDNHISSKIKIDFGVPQGSILGPILFLIFVNDTNQLGINCKIAQFADDTQILHTGTVKEINLLIQDAENTLTQAKNYFNRNGLLVNPNKTQCIFIGSRQNIARIPEDIIIRFDNSEINPSLYVKNLGIYFDQYMTFERHIDEMYKKIMGSLMYLNRIKNQVTSDMRVTLVQALALGYLNYCPNIWGTTSKTQLQRVQKLQNFAAKVAVGSGKKYDRATPYINKLEWIKIDKKCLLDICILTYKVLNQLLPDWLITFTMVSDINPFPTRQGNNLVVPRTQTHTGERGIKVRAPKLWNNLPLDVRNSSSLNVFKKKVKNFML